MKQLSFSKIINDIKPFLMMAVVMILLSFTIDMTTQSFITTQFGSVILMTAVILIILNKYLTYDRIMWIMNSGIFIKICYILYTAVWTRQHDVIDFGVGEGHAAYIEYILANKHLPDFDPTTVWSFFQPPLHHIISAAWMWISRRLGMCDRQMQENVQVLTLMYMCIVILVTYYLCKELELSYKASTVVMLVVSLHPMFTIFSGSINNDALSFALTVVAVYFAVKWYRKPSYLWTVLLALAIGLSMMAKLTSALVAPAIGVMMLYRMGKEFKKFIPKFLCFAVVVFPIGLFWPVRNYILFKTPFNYIPGVGQQLTHTGFVSRVLDIRMSSVYPMFMDYGDSYDEYNVWLALIKTSLFGEYNYGLVSKLITPFAVVIFVSAVILMIVALYATVKLCISKKSKLAAEYRILFGGTYLCFMIGYLSFALGYSNFSAQDFRYGATAIVIEALFLGLYYDSVETKSAKEDNSDLKKNSLTAVAYIFAISSFIISLLLGLLQIN